MACPKCGCKETYQFDEGDDLSLSDDFWEHCAACGHIFDVEDSLSEDDDEWLEVPAFLRRGND